MKVSIDDINRYYYNSILWYTYHNIDMGSKPRAHTLVMASEHLTLHINEHH